MNRLVHDLANFPLAGFLLLFALSAGSLLFWELLRLVTAPVSNRWHRWRRRLVPVAIATTVIEILLMGLRFAHFAKVI